jgi:hypothetical protein
MRLAPFSTHYLDDFRNKNKCSPLAVWKNGSYSDIPLCTQAVVVEDRLWHSLVEDARLLAETLSLAWAKMNDEDRDVVLRGISPLERSIIEQSDSLKHATMRFDLYWSPAARDFKIIEINCTIPAMQAYSEMAKAVALGPRERADGGQNTRQLLESIKQQLGLLDGQTLAILHREQDSQIAELEWFKSHWQTMNVLLATPSDLRWDGFNWYARDQKVDGIYRHLFAYRAVDCPQLAQGLKSRQGYVNSVSAHYESKAFLAFVREMLISGQLALGAETEDRLVQRIPAMSVLTSEQKRADALANARKLVFKRSVGYGGHSVVIGSQHTGEFLQQMLTENSTDVWIAQELVDGFRQEATYVTGSTVSSDMCYFDASVFLDSGPHYICDGGVSRFSSHHIVNIGTGGGLAPFFLESEWSAATLK